MRSPFHRLTTPPAEPRGEEFTRLLVRHQQRVRGLILALVTRGPDADDVMQETCAVMWRKFGEFKPGTDFGAWALRIARYQVLSHYDRRRRAEALQSCVSQLRERDFDLIQRRYRADEKVDEIALSLGSTVHAVYKALGRLHLRLLACVNAKLRFAQP